VGHESTAVQTEMLRLATESDFAMLGTLVDLKTVLKRLPEEELKKLDDLSKLLGGTVYAFHVEDVVIKRLDFGINTTGAAFAGNEILIFKLRGKTYSPNELYIKGKRYLIFATAIPDQSKLKTEYKLEPNKTDRKQRSTVSN
jgi:hypothetical protein